MAQFFYYQQKKTRMKEEHFEDQLNHIDDLSNTTLETSSDDLPNSKPQLTPKETKSAIKLAIKKKQISVRQGQQLLTTLGLSNTHTKKVISNKARLKKRKQQQKARKANRK